MSAARDITAAEEAAGKWFARRRSGAMSAEEARALAAWLEAPENAAALEMVERAWAGIEDTRRAPEILALRERARGRRAGFTRLIVTRAMAASLAVAVLGAGTFALYVDELTGARRFADERYATAVGEKEAITLPDGSVVTLNTDTVLRTRKVRDRREVYLDRGQAFFRVAKDKRRPFVVHAAGRTVTAVGTAFDVRVEGKRFEVTLIEGKVRVAGPTPAPARLGRPAEPPVMRTTEMLPGDRFIASVDSQLVVAHADTAQATSWIIGRLRFEGEPLGAVAGEFSRYSDRKIVIDDPVLAAKPVSGAFPAADGQAFAEALEIAGLARIASSDDGSIRLVAPGTAK